MHNATLIRIPNDESIITFPLVHNKMYTNPELKYFYQTSAKLVHNLTSKAIKSILLAKRALCRFKVSKMGNQKMQ